MLVTLFILFYLTPLIMCWWDAFSVTKEDCEDIIAEDPIGAREVCNALKVRTTAANIQWIIRCYCIFVGLMPTLNLVVVWKLNVED